MTPGPRFPVVLAVVLVAALLPPFSAAANDEHTRIAGPDRYATAAALARDTAGDVPAEAVVLARGDDFADALAGVPLAGALHAPLLLTARTELPAVTAEALADLTVDGATVHLLGGRAAIASVVADALRDDGYEVVRHAGDDRFATAATIADALPDTDITYLVSGLVPADALAAAAVAGADGHAVLLAASDRLPASTSAALDRYEEVRVVGGTAAVGQDVRDDVAARGADLVEIAGADRYATALAVAQRFRPEATGAGIASGEHWSDALTGARHAADRGWPLLLSAPARLPYAVAADVTDRREKIVVYGGEQAVSARAAADLDRALASDPGVAAQTGIDPGRVVGPAAEVRLGFSRPLAGHDLVVDGVAGVALRLDGTTVVATMPHDPAPGAHDLEIHGTVTDADGRRRLIAEPFVLVVEAGQRTSPEGWSVAGGTGPVVGAGGAVRSYTVEVEPATGWRVDAVLPVVTAALENTAHGWTARGQRRFQRIDDPRVASLRVVLATPDTVDAYCARHGVNTAGIYSCWDGARAMLNLYRWEHGAADFGDDLALYRRYLVNHEVGHGLGYGHVGCPAAGVPAPVMMQQTKTTGSCAPNGWPYP